MQPESVQIEPLDQARLRRAVVLLEKNSLITMLAQAIGRPVTAILSSLPNIASDAIQKVSRIAILQCLRIAMRPSRPNGLLARSGKHPKLISGLAGAVGGFLGLPALAIELPVTTVVLFQSIARIAVEEGEDLSNPETRLACLEVFALSSNGKGPAATDQGYYAMRNALAPSLDEAANHLLRRSSSQQTAPVLIQFISMIAARFGLIVSEEAAASAIPVVGAITGASLNIVFVQHFNNIARGHFAVRALERKYGQAPIRDQFEEVRKQLEAPKKKLLTSPPTIRQLER
jgi:hypothetical protein